MVRRRCLRAINPVGCTSLVGLPWGERTRSSRACGEYGFKAVAHPGTSSITADMPVNGRSEAVGVLLLSLSSGVFCSRVGREEDVSGVACPNHTPCSVRFLVHLSAPCSVGGHGSGAFEVDG